MERDRLQGTPLVIGHRGSAGHDVENTVGAFLNALAMGADGVECDVRSTGDGELVIFHDESLLRLASVPERLNRLKLADLLSRIRLGRDGENSVVPTLEEICQLPALQTAWLFLELKEQHCEKKVLQAVMKNRLSANTVLGSFHKETVRELNLAGNPNTLQLLERYEDFPPGNHFQFVGLHHEAVTVARVNEMHNNGLKVWAWTVNDSGDIRRMVTCGVDGIITDYPDRVRREIK